MKLTRSSKARILSTDLNDQLLSCVHTEQKRLLRIHLYGITRVLRHAQCRLLAYLHRYLQATLQSYVISAGYGIDRDDFMLFYSLGINYQGATPCFRSILRLTSSEF